MTALHRASLDPHPIGAPPRDLMDAVSYLTVYLVLLFGVPSHLTVTALGSLGDLAVLWGLLGLSWWAYVRLQQTSPIFNGTGPVKFALLGFFALVFVSYGALQLSGAPSEALSWTDSALIRSLSWAGVALVALDGIHDRQRYLVLVRRLVWAGGLMACLGLAQFVTGQALVDTISLPGFESGPEYATVFDRDGFTRAAGTAAHPLAYGSLLVTLLPLSIAVGIEDRTQTLLLRWSPAFALTVAALTSMSRSVLISTMIGLLLVLPAVPRKYRLLAIGSGLTMIAVMTVAVPGMLGSLRALFVGVGQDSSVASRIDSAGSALEIAMRHPFFGQGLGSFMPTELILDNQILLLFIEVGVLGLTAFVVLVGVCVWAGWRIWQKDAVARDRAYGVALAAGNAAALVNMCFYDALSFPLAAGLMFLMVGITGAALGMSRDSAAHPLYSLPR